MGGDIAVEQEMEEREKRYQEEKETGRKCISRMRTAVRKEMLRNTMRKERMMR